jgi:hypothetical protein
MKKHFCHFDQIHFAVENGEAAVLPFEDGERGSDSLDARFKNPGWIIQ